jgi:hypothetical protein
MSDCLHANLVLQEGPLHANDNPPVYRCKSCNEFLRVALTTDSIGVQFGPTSTVRPAEVVRSDG